VKTAKVNGELRDLMYKANTGMYTHCKSPHLNKWGQFGADVYTVDGDLKHIVLVGTSQNGSTLPSTTTVITAEQYAQLASQYDPYNEIEFHRAVMKALGFE